MKVIRQVGTISLNQGTSMARGLYNLMDSETDELSFWFNEEVKDSLLAMTDEQFIHEARVQFEVAELDDKTNIK